MFSGLYSSIQSKEENLTLDAILTRFLRFLSPYFLQACSFKVLEWLIRHDKINELNQDALMECILPYHETKQFTTVLATMVLPDTSRWAFLKPLQKSLEPLDRQTLVRKCSSDASILTFICDMTKESKAAKIHHRSLYTFFACTLVHYVQNQKILSENDVILLAPTLVQFLKISNPQYGDLQAAAQICVGQMAAKVSFESELLCQIIEAATKGLTNLNMGATILTVVTLCQLQQMEEFPTKPLSIILDTSDIASELISIVNTYDAGCFLRSFLMALVDFYLASLNAKAFNLFETIVKSGCVPSSLSSSLCERIVKEIKHENVNDVASLVKMMHSVLPKEMDTAISANLNLQENKDNALYSLTSTLFKARLSVFNFIGNII